MPQLILMMGGSGVGKSTVRTQRFPGMKVLDSDSIKESHPEYDPKDPGALHAWSTQVLMREIYAALGAGESFIYDGTGSNAERAVSIINHAHEVGYSVKVVMVTCPLHVAIERNAKRERVVPEWRVREIHAMLPTSFEIVSRYADEIEVVNN